MQEKSKYCCEDHMDRAFDDFLVEKEVFPHLNKAIDQTCSYCSKAAIYILEEPESDDSI